jgi:hypothetical protein
MSKAETPDTLLLVDIEALVVRVRAPLNHAEGQRRAGKGKASGGRSDQGIDCIVKAGRLCLSTEVEAPRKQQYDREKNTP